MTAILVIGFLVCVAATVGFGIGWYIGHEEGMDDMAEEIGRTRT